MRPVRWPRRLLFFLSFVAAITGAAFAWAYVNYNDERLGRKLSEVISAHIKGRLEVQKVHWGLRTLADLALGTASPLHIEGVSIYDSRGTEIIHVETIDAWARLWSLVADGEVRIRSVDIRGGQVLVHSTRHEGALVIGIAEAFQPASPSLDDRPAQVPLLLFEKISIHGIRFRLKIDETEIVLPDVRLQAQLRIEGDVINEGIHAIVTSLSAGKGFYRQHHLRAALTKLRSRDVRIDGQTLTARLRCNAGDAPARIQGRLRSLFRGVDLDVSARIDRASRLAKALTHLDFHGRSRVNLLVRGPADHLKVRTKTREFALTLGALKLHDIAATASLDVAKARIDLQDLRLAGLRGELSGRGQVLLREATWQLQTEVKGADLGPLVPALAGRLQGKATLNGQLSPLTGLAVLDVTLTRHRRRRRDFLPHRIGLRGTIHMGTRVVDLAGLTVLADGNSARARGSINIPRRRANVFLSFDLPRLGPWLADRVGIDPVRRARGRVHVTGRWPRLVATGEVQAKGVGIADLRLPRVGAQIAFSRGRFQLRKITARGYGGAVRGSARLDLFAGGNLLKPHRHPRLEARLVAKKLSLETLAKKPKLARGRLSAIIDVKGPLTSLKGVAELSASDLFLGGHRYRSAAARVGLLADRVSVYDAHLRRADGGRLRVWNDVFLDGHLALAARLTDMPLAAIPGFSQVKVPVTGRVSGGLKLLGTLTDPRPAGRLALRHATVRGAALGSGWLRFVPESDSLRIDGALFNRLIRIEGVAQMQPTHRLQMTVDVDRFPVHRVFPELSKLGDIRGIVSGRLQADLDEKVGLRAVKGRLSLVKFGLRYRPLGRRSYRVLEILNEGDLKATYDGHRVTVTQARLVSAVAHDAKVPQARFSAKGFLGEKRSELVLLGDIPLELAEFFLARRVKRITGRAVGELRVTGPLIQLVPQGRLELSKVAVRLPRFDRALEIPTAAVTLSQKALAFDRFDLKVGKRHLGIRGKVSGIDRIIDGHLGDGRYDLNLAGAFNARLLRLFFPRVFSLATGSASVAFDLRGPLTDPSLDGTVDLSRRHHVDLRPRGLGRTVTLSSGRVRLKRYLLTTVKPLRGTYDDGTLSLSGEARFDHRELVDIYVHFKGRGIPQRKPKVYAAEMNVDLTLVGDPSGRRLRCPLSKNQGESQLRAFMLTGNVDIVDARYTREFDVVKNAVVKPRVYEEEHPFWEGNKTIAGLGLCLSVRTTGQMKVKNRYANLGLETAMSVLGTLDHPSIDGTVRVEEGQFSIPFLRGNYKVDHGDIAFSEGKDPGKADLNIDAETEYVDRSGTAYQIRLNLKGPLDAILIKLSSQPVLEQGQILALLATGRTTEQLRNELNQNGGQGSAAGAADAQVKALSGMVLSSILEDPIKQVTGLDLVRLEIGFETLTAKGCKRIGSFEICGEYERDLLGGYSGKGSARYRLHDYLRLVGRLERLSTRFERERENPSRARLELRFSFPLR